MQPPADLRWQGNLPALLEKNVLNSFEKITFSGLIPFAKDTAFAIANMPQSKPFICCSRGRTCTVKDVDLSATS